MKQVDFFIWNVFYNLSIAFRIKQAIFFTVFFPVLIFMVFSLLWGQNQQEYIFYLLTGVICMTLASEGLFVIGSILKQYYESGFMKYINKLPIPISLYFFSLVISRFIIILIEIIILCVLANIIFELNIFDYHLNRLIVGALLGMIIFSFLGLCIHFIDIKNKGGEKGLINFVYFILLFTSDSFYPASQLNDYIGQAAGFLPFNPILSIMREGYDEVNWLIVLIWCLLPVLLFSYIFNRYKVSR